MANNQALDSHLSQKGSAKPSESDSVRMHHRLAQGLPVNGQSNPNGGAASTKNTVRNDAGKNY